MFHWMLEAYITVAEILVDQGRIPQFPPTAQQAWAPPQGSRPHSFETLPQCRVTKM